MHVRTMTARMVEIACQTLAVLPTRVPAHLVLKDHSVNKVSRQTQRGWEMGRGGVVAD